MNSIDEVRKCLACCSRRGYDHCRTCSYDEEESCIEELAGDALDILAKLQSENDALKAELKAAQQAINSLKQQQKWMKGLD